MVPVYDFGHFDDKTQIIVYVIPLAAFLTAKTQRMSANYPASPDNSRTKKY